MAYPAPNIIPSGTTWAQLQAAGASGHLERLIAANALGSNAPTVAATAAATGGASSGGSLAPGTYYFVFTETDVDAMGGGVVAQIVHVAVKIDFLEQGKVGAIEDAQFAFAAGYEKFLGAGSIGYALRIGNAGDGLRANAGADVDDFHGVVAQSGDEELIFSVEAEMIKAALTPGVGMASVRTRGRGGSGAVGV